MKKLLVIVLVLVGCAFPDFVNAQSTNDDSTPFISQLESFVIDTNSTFFTTGTLEIRALSQTTLSQYESVISASWYPFHDDKFGLGVDMVNGSANLVDATYITIEWDLPIHNVKIRPIIGVGRDFINNDYSIELGGGAEIAISKIMFSDAELIYKTDLSHFLNAPQTEARFGLGFHF